VSETATSIGGLKLGAEPKKVGALLLMLVLAGFLWWRNSSDSPSSSAPASTSAGKVDSAIPVPGGATPRTARPLRRRGQNQNERNAFEMRPIDPSRGDVDPTLRLELLDRLHKVKLEPVGRSLFEAGAVAPSAGTTGPGGFIIKPKPAKPSPSPVATTPVNTGPPPTPPAPPIPLKFYGFIRPINKRDVKRGFFMDGDVILMATEGETLKQRYHVIKFQETSATVEDTTTKSQQTLPLVPEAKVEN
jgi:hypothetical protein